MRLSYSVTPHAETGSGSVAAEANLVSRRQIRRETRSRESLTLIRLSYAVMPLAEPPNRFPCAVIELNPLIVGLRKKHPANIGREDAF
jgi:hypothetical protein